MALSNEMRRITQGFVAAYDDRIARVVDICDNTARELSGFRAAHKSMAADQRQRLTDYVYGLHDNVTKMLESLDTAHKSMAVEQRQRLADYTYELRDNVANMLESLDTAHKSMAVEQRERLADYVYDLCDNVTKTLQMLDKAHQSMAAKQRKHLAAGRKRLASDVSKTRGDLHADQSEARKIWNGFATVMQERRAKKSGGPAPKAPVAKAKAAQIPAAVARPPITVAKEAPVPQATAQVIPDKLTTIGGIGASMQQHLNEMGIYTFAQLAGSTPQKVRKALGESGRLANVDRWIEDARKLRSAPGDSA